MNSSSPYRATTSAGSDRLVQQPGDSLQYLIAGLMPMVVVHAFEEVDIDHQQGQRPFLTVGTLPFRRQPLIEGGTIGRIGQAIMGRAPFEFPIQPLKGGGCDG
jgi:hypothetical protein